MLHRVLEYATSHGITSEEGFTIRKNIKWLIAFDASGKNPTVISPGEDDAFPPELCPDAGTKAQGDAAHFLSDKLSVVVRYVGTAEPSTETGKHRYFVKELQEASTAMPVLQIATGALSDNKNIKLICAQLKRLGAKKGDFAMFRVGNTTPVKETDWHDWWRQKYGAVRAGDPGKQGRRSSKRKDPLMRCILTGELVTPAERHETKIRGLGGRFGGRGGDSLIAFDKDAFKSLGLKESLNAATSSTIAKQYATALNHLIDHQSSAIASTRFIYWYKEKVDVQDDVLPWVTASTEMIEADATEQARKLFSAVREGKKPDLATNNYYSMLISGSSGRVMVRGWDEGSLSDLVTHVQQWLEHQEITAIGGDRIAKWPTLEGVIAALLPMRKPNQDYADWIKPVGHLVPVFWQAALKGTLIPEALCRRLVPMLPAAFLALAQSEPEKTPDQKREHARQLSLLYRRMGLLKAYYIRTREDHAMQPYLNKNHPNSAYHCGRVLAVFARLQRAALGDVGAGVVQRYYTAMSQTPGLVLGRLAANAKNHLGKLSAKDARDAEEYENKISEVMSRIGDSVPRTLTLEEQGLFALGYYQQLAVLNM